MLKLSKKLLIKDSGNNVVAIIDTDGKTLTNDKKILRLIEFYKKSELLKLPIVKEGYLGTSYKKPENEFELKEVLEENLPDFGFSVSN
jgi:hypothetical protein